jgi:hypothetical protein
VRCVQDVCHTPLVKQVHDAYHRAAFCWAITGYPAHIPFAALTSRAGVYKTTTQLQKKMRSNSARACVALRCVVVCARAAVAPFTIQLRIGRAVTLSDCVNQGTRRLCHPSGAIKGSATHSAATTSLHAKRSVGQNLLSRTEQRRPFHSDCAATSLPLCASDRKDYWTRPALQDPPTQ